MRITVFGSGTSTGVPVPGCNCAVCISDSPRNKRLRTSILLQDKGKYIVIDTSTDLRAQALRAKLPRVDLVLITHTHADHVNGLDDLRSYNYIMQSTIPIYAEAESARELQHRFAYAFYHDPSYQGGAPPQLDLKSIPPYELLDFAGIKIMPLLANHGNIDVLGFRFGNFAYVTDCKSIPERSMGLLQDLDVLILGALRVRQHPTHFTFEEAVVQVEKLKPKKCYFTHLSHEVDFDEGNAFIKGLTKLDVQLIYDELEIEL